jgi:hypothetical protein
MPLVESKLVDGRGGGGLEVVIHDAMHVTAW